MNKLTRWNPVRDMQNLEKEFDRFLEPFSRQAERGDDLMRGQWAPAVDVEETGDKLYLRAELPGMKAEDIRIDFENGMLTLSGERKFESERHERNFHRLERSYGSFVRTFILPTTVDVNGAKANYNDGVLELELPKREEAKPKRISIGVNTTKGELGTGEGPKAAPDMREKSSHRFA